METFEFKPAALSQTQTVSWDNASVRLEAGGKAETINWADIASVRYWTMRFRAIDYYGVILKSADNRSIALNINVPLEAGTQDPFVLSYYHMLESMFHALREVQPDLSVDYGQPPKYEWMYFGIGLLSLAFSLFMLFFLIVEESDKLMQAGVPVGVMALFGGFLMWSFRPGRKGVQFSLTAMIELVQSRLTPVQM